MAPLTAQLEMVKKPDKPDAYIRKPSYYTIIFTGKITMRVPLLSLQVSLDSLNNEN